MPQKPEILQVELAANTRIFHIEKVDLKFQNGEERIFERLISRRKAVIIVPMIDAENILLIREYAVGVEDYELTFPKGLTEHEEPLLEAALRELREETGYAARQLTLLRELTLAPGFMTHRTAVILAQDLYAAPLVGDEPEPLELVTWPLANITELLERPDFSEGRSHAALWLALRHI